MSKRKKLEDLNLSDDYLFYEVMSDADIAKDFLETVLDVKIRSIVYNEGEKTVRSNYTGKAVRLDLCLDDDNNTVYMVEMQSKLRGHLPKRARKYSAQLDFKRLKEGEEYDKMKPQIVIFICTFDLYHQGQYKYTFTNRCHEVEDLEMGDETKKIYLNTQGAKGEISRGLKAFLSYVEKSTPENAEELDDPLVKKISDRVEEIKRSDEKRGAFMTLDEYVYWENKEVAEATRKEVEAEKDREFAEKQKTEKRELAMKLQAKGMSAADIAELTGLSAEEIEKL